MDIDGSNKSIASIREHHSITCYFVGRINLLRTELNYVVMLYLTWACLPLHLWAWGFYSCFQSVCVCVCVHMFSPCFGGLVGIVQVTCTINRDFLYFSSWPVYFTYTNMINNLIIWFHHSYMISHGYFMSLFILIHMYYC